MSEIITIAVDAMGGDKGPRIVIEAIDSYLASHHDVFFKIFGDEYKLVKLIRKTNNFKNNYEIINVIDVIGHNVKPSEALRGGRSSSMRLAINAVKSGEANAVISCGNTGALMAMSKFVLGTIENIDRPAICTALPTHAEPCVLLDLGANVDCNADQLLQFAIMGDAFSRTMFEIPSPRIALMNIGSEALKGNKLVQDAANLIKQQDFLNYVGFAESDKIFSGNFDVIVCDGFTGNIALKSIEGTAKFLISQFKSLFKKSVIAYIGALLFGLLGFFTIRRLFLRLDPRQYNGALLIGLNGICVKSHGGADKVSLENAIKTAVRLVKNEINHKIRSELISRV